MPKNRKQYQRNSKGETNQSFTHTQKDIAKFINKEIQFTLDEIAMFDQEPKQKSPVQQDWDIEADEIL